MAEGGYLFYYHRVEAGKKAFLEDVGDLVPCPFCGRIPRKHVGAYLLNPGGGGMLPLFSIVCNLPCKMHVNGLDLDQLIAFWNGRAGVEAMKKVWTLREAGKLVGIFVTREEAIRQAKAIREASPWREIGEPLEEELARVFPAPEVPKLIEGPVAPKRRRRKKPGPPMLGSESCGPMV